MGPNAGYYSYDPTLVLKRPIAIAGPLGAGTQIVGAYLSQRTGLPFVDLDRGIEHLAGQSLLELHLTKGAGFVHRMERKLMKKVLAQNPPAIVALGEGALSSSYARFFATRNATLVYLKHEREILDDQLSKLSANDLAIFTGVLPNENVYSGYLKKRSKDFESCAHTLFVGSRSAVHVAHEIIEREENRWQ